MATSGKFNTTAWSSGSGNRYLEFSWVSLGSYPATLKTDIQWTLTAKGTYSGYVMAAPFKVVIDGKTVYNSSTRIKLYANQVVATGEATIQHNANGKKSFAASVNAAIYSASVNCSGSKTFTLDRIGTASITKAPNFNDEENPTIEYQNPLGNDAVELQAAISFTGANVDIPYRDIPKTGTSYTFELTEEERDILRAGTKDSNSRKLFFYVRTVWKGTTYFNYKQVSFSVINAAPTVYMSIIDINENTLDLTERIDTLIKYHSTAKATVSAIGNKMADITGYRIDYNGTSINEDNLTVENVEVNTFTFTAFDSRGNSLTTTITAPMVEYIKPTVNIDYSELMTTEGNYTLKCGGNFFNNTFGDNAAAELNMLSLQYRYKTQNGAFTDWHTMTVSVPGGNSYTAEANINGLDYRQTYLFQCKAVDALETIETKEFAVKSLPVFHWGEDDFTFEVPVNFNAGAAGINEIDGDLRIKGDTLAFGEGDTAYIQQTANDALSLNAADIHLNGNVYVGANTTPLSGLNTEAGTWVPTLSKAAAVNSYPTQRGWYMRVGNITTIGFMIKAYIKAGYESTALEINTPFNPRYAAFGGGVAHNIYVSAGFCFEGWSLQDGVIAARLQPCNNTAAGNLNISSSAYYPTTTNQTLITLSGTICYMED